MLDFRGTEVGNSSNYIVTNPANGTVSAQAVQQPAATQGGVGGILGAIGAGKDAATGAGKGGAGGLLGALGAGKGAAGGAGKGGGGGLLGGLLGGLGKKRETHNEKRVVGSRIVERALAGKWI
jgi:hypothetical protein